MSPWSCVDVGMRARTYPVLLVTGTPLRSMAWPGMPKLTVAAEGTQTLPECRPECGSRESTKKFARLSRSSWD